MTIALSVCLVLLIGYMIAFTNAKNEIKDSEEYEGTLKKVKLQGWVDILRIINTDPRRLFLYNSEFTCIDVFVDGKEIDSIERSWALNELVSDLLSEQYSKITEEDRERLKAREELKEAQELEEKYKLVIDLEDLADLNRGDLSSFNVDKINAAAKKLREYIDED